MQVSFYDQITLLIPLSWKDLMIVVI